MEPIITVNEYPIGWEWLDKVPLEDFNWLIEIFATMTDNTDTYDFAIFHKKTTSGISMYGHYIACKSLDISSEEEYMNQFTDIKLICNEL